MYEDGKSNCKELVYFADADSVLDRPTHNHWRSLAENYGRVQALPGASEELILDFWEQAQASQLQHCDDYGGEESKKPRGLP